MGFTGKQGLILLVILWTLNAHHALEENDHSISLEPVVSTISGKITGKYVKVEGKDVSSFTGIPFAEPSVGGNRFRKPVPRKKWDGVYDATKKPPPCMQQNENDLPWLPRSEPSEDCLFLNIWVPGKCSRLTKMQSKKLPVMVWIYGGGYYSGSSGEDIYDGATFSAIGNVVVVTMNYRVGSFGFFTSGNEDAPGNMGLLDQALALEWIKENIENFGGDPNNLTLFGESAGAVSVGLHMISPMSRDLFHKAIMQSASPYHPQLATPQAVALFKSNLFAASVGCADDKVNLQTQPGNVVECLRGKSAAELAKAESLIIRRLPYFFLPVTGDEFLPQSPVEAIESGNFKDMPLLIGTNKDEGAVFLHQLLPEYFRKESAAELNLAQATMVIMGLFQNNTHPPPNIVADYYLSGVPESDKQTIVKRVQDSFGDFVFVCPSLFLAEKMKHVYYYVFAHRPTNTAWGNWMGVTHFEDVAFVFGKPIKSPQSYTKEEAEFSREIIRKWSTFAKTGTPGECKESWPKYTAENHLYKELNLSHYKLGTGPHLEACDFWRSYFAGER